MSETFPLEMRALAIAFFYAIGTGVGGVAGPVVFGLLIDSGSRTSVFAGYLFAAALMVAAAWRRLALRRRGGAPAARKWSPAPVRIGRGAALTTQSNPTAAVSSRERRVGGRKVRR